MRCPVCVDGKIIVKQFHRGTVFSVSANCIHCAFEIKYYPLTVVKFDKEDRLIIDANGSTIDFTQRYIDIYGKPYESS